MLFRKKKVVPSAAEEPSLPLVDPQVLATLDRLQRAGVPLVVRPGGAEDESYTTAVVGLGRDGFFVDTLTPPGGDVRARAGGLFFFETLYQGILYRFEAPFLGKVQFVDELPAFKLEYPQEIQGERRRKSPRVDTSGDASLSFLRPFQCDAPVVNLSEGGLAFEHGVELGRLRKGTVIRDILLEMGTYPVLRVQGRVVGQVICQLGGLGLPRRCRVSLAFQGLSDSEVAMIQAYLSGKSPGAFIA